MFCLFENIYICGVNDLNLLNLQHFNYIINCSKNLNNLIINNNFLNLNINKIDYTSVNLINQALDFIIKCINENSKIILLDNTGLDFAMFIGIVFLIKYYNLDFNSVYDTLKIYTKLNNKEYYNDIYNIESYFYKNNFQTNSINNTKFNIFNNSNLLSK